MTIDLAAFLAENNSSDAEFWVLCEVSYAERHADVLPSYARGLHRGLRSTTYPKNQYEIGLEDLLARRLLQIVDLESVTKVESILTQEPSFGPTEGLPQLGNIDFTIAGAALWKDLQTTVWGAKEFSGTWPDYYAPGKCMIYSMEKSLVEEALYGYFDSYSYTAGPVEHIGPWRSRWWEIFPNGFRVDVHYEDK